VVQPLLSSRAKPNRWLGAEEGMPTRLLVRIILIAVLAGGLGLELQTLSAAQVHANVAFDSFHTSDDKNAADNDHGPATSSKLDEIIDRMIKREHDEITAFDLYNPIIETYIQELLNKSPYASKLANAGLFLRQLHLQSRTLKQLISPQLGNEIYLADQLLQVAPSLQPDNKSQIAALPLGSRLKIDPWSASVTLMKSKPIALLSGRDKMPFSVTPLVP
jgi:hypothetical protein